MSIKSQKIINFIPIINIAIMFVWISFYFKNVMKMKRFLKNVLIIFLGMIIVNIPRIVLNNFIQSDIIQIIVYCVSIYLTLFVIARIAIWDQEKYYAEKNSQG